MNIIAKVALQAKKIVDANPEIDMVCILLNPEDFTGESNYMFTHPDTRKEYPLFVRSDDTVPKHKMLFNTKRSISLMK
jgi:hypothetical protein